MHIRNIHKSYTYVNKSFSSKTVCLLTMTNCIGAEHKLASVFQKAGQQKYFKNAFKGTKTLS